MMNRFSFLAALTLVVSLATGAQAQSNVPFGTIAQQDTRISANYSGSTLASTLTLGGAGVNFSFNVLNAGDLIAPGPLQYNNVEFILTATSNNAAVDMGPNNALQTGFSGTFSIVANGGSVNILSGTFLVPQNGAGASLAIGRNSSFFSIDAGDVTFTSDIFDPDRILGAEQFNFAILSTTPEIPALGGGVVAPFTSRAVSGNFAAIPEPATLAMAGLGILALPLAVRATRRRRSN